MELGNGLRAGRVSLQDFRAALSHGPLSLRYIQLDKVVVVDHLGRNIPVPTMFCSTWKAFDYIINGYCRDRFGDRFVEYQVLRAEDSQVIRRSEIATVRAEMILEMSIVLRQIFQETKGKCPRCNHIDLNPTVNGGWIECFKCSGQFRVAKTNSIDGDQNDGVSDIMGGKGGHEAINSPASRNGRSEDEDGTQFFRRITLVAIVASSLSTLARSKLLSVGDNLSVGDKDSLHRWVLLKNSTLRSSSTFLSTTNMYPPDEECAVEEEQADSFLFPNAGKLNSLGGPGVGASEAEWLDSLLETRKFKCRSFPLTMTTNKRVALSYHPCPLRTISSTNSLPIIRRPLLFHTLFLTHHCIHLLFNYSTLTPFIHPSIRHMKIQFRTTTWTM